MAANPVEASPPRTMLDKIWEAHEVVPATAQTPAVLYVDLHLVHEVTSPQAFDGLERRGLPVRRPERVLATMDHSTPTTPLPARGLAGVADVQARAQLERLAANCGAHDITLHGLGDARQGIIHVIAPELGATHPGMTVVCGDSHTATHGALGAFAFGIGTSEVGHVLATQCLLQRKPKTLRVEVNGALPFGVTAKDLILAMIARLGAGGGTGHVIEYAGSAIQSLDIEGRMTVCNMSIEAGARAGMTAPDDTTFEYLAGRERAPQGAAWERALERWRQVPSDPEAAFDRTIEIDAGHLAPMITWGTTPAMAIPIDGTVPDPDNLDALEERATLTRALLYMGLRPRQQLAGTPVDAVFIGSCTNGRLSDLRDAARIMRGRRVADGVRVLVVPGSHLVKREAEAEGLADVFRSAGAEWREPGCSMCIAMNGDQLKPGQLAVSTSNRNFEGRQGPGSRTLLTSPLTAAASAVTGRVADPRPWLR
jgi:3-isopropylmalate/(R)-2-methylmalate dehydratase large subunit